MHSGKDSLDAPFPFMIRFQYDCSNEGHDGWQRQVKVGTVVICFIRIKLQNWHSCVEMAVGCQFTAGKYMIVRTISLNKVLCC